MIIFGWGHQKRNDHGPVDPMRCNHCNNEQPWRLLELSTWFILFFIPVIPYERKRLLICPVCSYSFEIDSAAFEKLAPIAGTNQAYLESKITKEEYDQKMASFNESRDQTASDVEK